LKIFALALALWCGAAVAAVPEPSAEAAMPQASEPEDARVSEALAHDTSATLLQHGWATWYGGKRWHGRRTASGERFDCQALTAAHKTLPLGSRVRVVNLSNGREVTVRINDRGPFTPKFIIDLSEAAAERLGMRHAGRAQVALHRSAALHKQAR
jgi:rare lipoprotein A